VDALSDVAVKLEEFNAKDLTLSKADLAEQVA
jgi:hypothetical protein